MSERFLKLIDSEESRYLLANHPMAFLLLTQIALRVSREGDAAQDLQAGECRVGDWEGCGLTRQQYRTALAILQSRGHIEIVETCRTRSRGLVTKGTLVKLVTKSVYDLNINLSYRNDLTKNDLTTTLPAPPKSDLTQTDSTVYTPEKLYNFDLTKNDLTTTLATTLATTLDEDINTSEPEVYEVKKSIDNHLFNHEINHVQEEQHKKYTRKQQSKDACEAGCALPLAVVVFSSISNLDWLTQKQKEEICSKYDEQTVVNALAVITEPTFKPRGTLLQSLRAGCLNKWAIASPRASYAVLENRALADQFDNRVVGVFRFLACNDCLSITRTDSADAIDVSYDMSHDEFKRACAKFTCSG